MLSVIWQTCHQQTPFALMSNWACNALERGKIILALAAKENGGQGLVRDGAIDNLAEWLFETINYRLSH
jgi:hypothetical protein